MLRRAAVRTSTSGSTPRTRSRTGGCSAGRGAPRGTRVAAGRGGPAAAHLQRHRRRGAGHRAGRAGAADRRAGRDRRRRPGRAARLARPPSTTWPGCGETGLADAIAAHAARRQAAARHLRRLPDARRAIHDDVESRPGHGRRAWACCRSRSRSARARPLARSRARRCGAPVQRLRDPPRVRRPAATRVAPLLHYADGRPEGAPAGQRRSARTGTARSSPTSSAARFLTEAARLAGRHGFAVAPDTAFAARPGARPRPARRPGRGAPRHGRAVAAHRARRASTGLPFIPPGAPGAD